MCYHRLYIYLTCGHTTTSTAPVPRTALCPYASPNKTCPKAETHPMHSLSLHDLCPPCTLMRDARLATVANTPAISRYAKKIAEDDWRWKVQYRSPVADQDSWKNWGLAKLGPGRDGMPLSPTKMKAWRERRRSKRLEEKAQKERRKSAKSLNGTNSSGISEKVENAF